MHCSATSVTFVMSENVILLLIVALVCDTNTNTLLKLSNEHAKCYFFMFCMKMPEDILTCLDNVLSEHQEAIQERQGEKAP